MALSAVKNQLNRRLIEGFNSQIGKTMPTFQEEKKSIMSLAQLEAKMEAIGREKMQARMNEAKRKRAKVARIKKALTMYFKAEVEKQGFVVQERMERERLLRRGTAAPEVKATIKRAK